MHLYNFERLTIQLKWEGERDELFESFVEADQSAHILGATVPLVLLQQLHVVEEVVDI